MMNKNNICYIIGIILGSIWPLHFGWSLVKESGVGGMMVGYIMVCAAVSFYKLRLSNKHFGVSVLLVGAIKLIQMVSFTVGFISIIIVSKLIGHDIDIKNDGIDNALAIFITIVHGSISCGAAILISLLINKIASTH